MHADAGGRALAAKHGEVNKGVKGGQGGATRFPKGVSGNLNGRPRGSHRELPYEAVLGQLITVRENDVTREMRADNAFIRMLKASALSGDAAHARLLNNLIEEVPDKVAESDKPQEPLIVQIVTPGSVNTALRPLRMAVLLYPYQKESVRMAIEPWMVEAALKRLGSARLSAEQQRTVVAATRTPSKVKWPDWWTSHP